jgi:hypothetical protein
MFLTFFYTLIFINAALTCAVNYPRYLGAKPLRASLIDPVVGIKEHIDNVERIMLQSDNRTAEKFLELKEDIHLSEGRSQELIKDSEARMKEHFPELKEEIHLSEGRSQELIKDSEARMKEHFPELKEEIYLSEARSRELIKNSEDRTSRDIHLSEGRSQELMKDSEDRVSKQFSEIMNFLREVDERTDKRFMLVEKGIVSVVQKSDDNSKSRFTVAPLIGFTLMLLNNFLSAGVSSKDSPLAIFSLALWQRRWSIKNYFFLSICALYSLIPVFRWTYEHIIGDILGRLWAANIWYCTLLDSKRLKQQ